MITRVALGAILLVGCGDSGSAGGDGGVDGPGGPDAPKPTKGGFVLLSSYTAEQPPGTMLHGGSASAGFSSASSSSSCVAETFGDCVVADCVPGPRPPVSAGTITVTGASLPISLVPVAAMTYPSVSSGQQAYFSGGETVTFAAAGADVPAFTVSITTPSKATITMPVEAPILALDRTYAFTARWTGGGSGNIQIFFSGGTTSNVYVNCKFAASAGTGVVPAGAIGRLPAGQGSFAINAVSDSEVVTGDFGILAQGYYNSVWPDGSIASGATMVQ